MRKYTSYSVYPENIYNKEISKIKLLDANEEREVARRLQRGDLSAKEELVTSNLRFVVKVAKRYMNRGLPLMDLIEEGNFGLMRAAEKFDPERGFRFSTYSIWWIRQSIERAIMNQGRTVRLPVHVLKRMNKFKKVKEKMRNESSKEPSYESIASKLDVQLPLIARKILHGEKTTISLDIPLSSGSSQTIADTVEDENTLDPSACLANTEMTSLISDWLGTLSSQQREIIVRRFGLFGFDNMSLQNVSNDIGLTRERVRQIQYRALAVLRRKLSGDGFGPNELYKN